MSYVCRAEDNNELSPCHAQGLMQCDYCTWYQSGCGEAHYPTPAIVAKTVWFPEGNPFAALPFPYINLLGYNGAVTPYSVGYYTVKRYYIFHGQVIDQFVD